MSKDQVKPRRARKVTVKAWVDASVDPFWRIPWEGQRYVYRRRPRFIPRAVPCLITYTVPVARGGRRSGQKEGRSHA